MTLSAENRKKLDDLLCKTRIASLSDDYLFSILHTDLLKGISPELEIAAEKCCIAIMGFDTVCRELLRKTSVCSNASDDNCYCRELHENHKP